ncbi:hypothetical protein, partial [Neomesorhizobium albiziae]|uniref:hypothetical protein n=1 Tax=Neomesorhizobium albiziae TaxID=335020 RepID=UPI0024E156D8
TTMSVCQQSQAPKFRDGLSGNCYRCTNDVAALIKIGFAVCTKIVADLNSDPGARNDHERALTLKRIR